MRSDASNISSHGVPTSTRAIAVISGKGGTGKTMLLAAIAKILDLSGSTVTVVDADTGTGGLTYYLGVDLVTNTAVGLSDLIAPANGHVPISSKEMLQPIKGMDRALFLGVGDHRRLFRELEHEELPSKLGDIVRSLKSLGSSYVLVDCRGGIDPESLAICSAVDEIILVAEADTTSFQASQHVVDILNAHQLGTKLRGFIINKVIDDPSVVIRTGTSVFRCTNLGAVPFDLEATRAFLIGELPPLRSPFLVHTWAAVQKLAPGDVPEPPGRPWTRREFREIGFANLESVRGGAVLAGVLFLICVLLPLSITSADRVFGLRVYDMLVISGLTLGLLGCFEPFRRALGKIVLAYVDVLSRRLK